MSMNIVMLTNTYAPHVGGVARSVEAFSAAYRQRGHSVLVVAPVFPNMPEDETDVFRMPAVQNFNGSDFSVALPVPGLLTEALDAFAPDIIHAHHPYLLGMTALRVARYRELPLVFTHHTLYEQYTHYVPVDSPNFKRFVIELATHYANLSDHVFAPSESVEALVRRRGVHVPITVIPTGVNIGRFADGYGQHFRAHLGIPPDAFVVGHLGRLAPEKNLSFLGEAIAAFLHRRPHAHCLLGGSGPSDNELQRVFRQARVEARVHNAGVLQGNALCDAYHAMDVFAFASKSETQGMVLTEAMAAGVPVVALDASGVREVVQDGQNGRLIREEEIGAFVKAFQWIADITPAQRQALQDGVRATAEAFSMAKQADRALACYSALAARQAAARHDGDHHWERILHLLHAEWEIIRSMATATGAALARGEPLQDTSS